MSGDIKHTVLSADFIRRWRDAFAEFYHYSQEGEFLIVPSLKGTNTYSYLPGLTYTDKLAGNCSDLLNDAQGKRYTIRTIDPDKEEFGEHEPVIMRLDISSGEKELIFHNLHESTRKLIRRAQRGGVVTRIGKEKVLLDDFYLLYTSTMHRLGSPPFARDFLDTLARFIELEAVVAYVEKKPAASLLMVYDDAIGWCPYGGDNRDYNTSYANELVYLDAIYRSMDLGKRVFDFGRCPYTVHRGHGTYWFKEKMGGHPVGLTNYRHKDEDIYSKYTMASSIWKKLPKGIADFIGPKLRRYLADG
ncbi:MAG: peptidoglycan bridge formation glycyltransferase FemA/FemB family protein [Sulfuricurvum sp.]|jgi:lipid II:glycine glycyltransferase (peptidoglycan interpeptide bridge formation enzyme)|uniref:GNAT family N-acetyltransferase n=1 Tax=Sulfuricurvum sp. TaxID=2025608 RepID=UPI0025CB7FDB|nr:GNAT family N-acetyltransferase [Sulfuricurvum sp.]MCK9372245.1 peptidoglycan bridge formation glycyltransferase FemA/FemB family protein [Sulfuricurvum sp.]